MAIISHMFPHPNKYQLHETRPKHQQYIKYTRTTLKEDLRYKNNKPKTIKRRTSLKLKKKQENTVLDAVHDHCALKFCKAISSTCDENSTYQTKNYNEKRRKSEFYDTTF